MDKLEENRSYKLIVRGDMNMQRYNAPNTLSFRVARRRQPLLAITWFWVPFLRVH